MGVDVTYALSPQAKAKIGRPYCLLQDRIVRTCALESLTTLEDVRTVLRDEVDRYNNHQVHSTTGEIPSIRFENARKTGNSLYHPFALPNPYTSPKDAFCLREMRNLNGFAASHSSTRISMSHTFLSGRTLNSIWPLIPPGRFSKLASGGTTKWFTPQPAAG